MTATAAVPSPHDQDAGGTFRDALHAEWTKFRTVRGWVLATLAVPGLIALLAFLTANGTHSGFCPSSNPASCETGHPFVPTGPAGRAVADTYELVGDTLDGNGSLTARVTSLTGLTSTTSVDQASSTVNSRPGLAAWAKAGVILTTSNKPGAPYAAMMVTGAHGDRFQTDFTHDTPGLPGEARAGSPHWLRIVRTGNRITGYDSRDGRHWTETGATSLGPLPATVHAGLFVTSPVTFEQTAGTATQATASFDHVILQGHTGARGWHGETIGSGPGDFYPTLGTGGYHRSGTAFVVRGSGDIAAGVVEGILSTQTASSTLPLGLIVALVVLIVVATLSIAGEYRRGLIRTTLTAVPRRRQVLAAKATILALVAFAAGGIAAGIALPLGTHLLTRNGNYVFPAGMQVDLRIVVGTGAFLALTTIASLALSTILRSSIGAISAGIVAFVLPYILASSISGNAETWLLRTTPAAGLAILEALPYSAQVGYPYTYANGYSPLSPWAGLAVLVAYALITLAIAAVVLQRRDA